MKDKNLQLVMVSIFAIALLCTGISLLVYENAEVKVPNDLNNDGVVNITDFSIALDQLDKIMVELRNQNVPANVIEEVYPDVPPYSPHN